MSKVGNQMLKWSHKSVRQFAPKSDPLGQMLAVARATVLQACDEGWPGPPFDPTILAEMRKIPVRPVQDVVDARTVSEGGRLVIQFNPDQPRARQRYSIAHEIAHTFFPDAHEEVRHRLSKGEMRKDDWQLELLCNVGAAELLMPIGCFRELAEGDTSIDRVLELRKKFEVSVEAVCIRMVHLTSVPCAMFVAACRDLESLKYRIDYTIPSRSWSLPGPSRTWLPAKSVVRDCTAIGYTAKGAERWPISRDELMVECVGVPPYPGDPLPRVVGIVRESEVAEAPVNELQYVRGDATTPRGDGKKIIAHVVNDKTPNWGGDFAKALRRKWREAQSDFVRWVERDRSMLRLGNSRLCWVEDDVAVYSMVCQRGYGDSATPRIRYAALAKALAELGDLAAKVNASVHMPTIGCGLAGGRWEIVSELIDDSLCQRGVSTTVYQLPDQRDVREVEEPHLFSPRGT